jgi:hypothetical protein
MKPTSIKLEITAESLITHGAFGARAGNAVPVRRVAGGLRGETIPAISGNALRGLSRRIVFRELFSRQNLTRESLDGFDRLYAALANGGHLEASDQNANPDTMRALRDCIPLSVFGAALFKMMLEGRLSVGWAWPRCQERGTGDRAAESLISETTQTRHVDREEHEPKETGVTPMPVTYETFNVGTVFDSEWLFMSEPTDLEIGCAVWAASQIVHVGGKAAAGMGRVGVVHDGDTALAQAFDAWMNTDEAAESVLAVLPIVAK